MRYTLNYPLADSPRTAMTGNVQRALCAGLLTLSLALWGCQTPEQKAAGYLSTARKDMENNRFADAVLRLRIAARIKPRDADLHYYLGLAYWGNGDPGQAASEWTAATELNPKHTQAQVRLAELAARYGQGQVLADARNQIQQIVAQTPSDAGAWYTLALAEWKLGKPEDAARHLQEALSRLPSHLEAAGALARIQLEKGDFPAAEKTVLGAAARAPGSVDAAVAAGRFYLVAGKPAEALKRLLGAVEIDGKSGPALLALGEAQLATGDRSAAEKTFARLSALPGRTYRGVHASYLLGEQRYAEAAAELEPLVRKDAGDGTLRGYLVAAYMGAGRLADAEKLLTAALAANKNDLAASLQWTQMLLHGNRIREAETGLGQVMRSHANLAQGHVLLAAVYEARHNPRGQRAELAEALRISPGMFDVRARLVRGYLAAGEANTAMDTLDRTPEAQKASPEFALEKNWVLFAKGDFGELRARLDAVPPPGRTAEAWLQDGLLNAQMKRYDEAAAALREALRLAPQDLRVIPALARVYVTQKRIDLAEALIADCAARFPASAPIQTYVGGWMAATGRMDKARAAFQRAKAADPGYGAADMGLARVASMERKWDEARRILNPLCSGDSAAAAHMLLAGVDEATGDNRSAVEHYKKAIAEDAGNAVALNNAAYLLADDPQRLDEALGYAKRALEIAPSPGLYDTLGWISYRKGQYAAAVGYLEKAVGEDANARRRYHLAMAYFKAGDAARGRAVLKTAQAMDPSLPEAAMALAAQSETAAAGAAGNGRR